MSEQPPSAPAVVTPALPPVKRKSARRALREEIERRYVVLPANAGTPAQYTKANIAAAFKAGRERLMTSLALDAIAQPA